LQAAWLVLPSEGSPAAFGAGWWGVRFHPTALFPALGSGVVVPEAHTIAGRRSSALRWLPVKRAPGALDLAASDRASVFGASITSG